MKQSFELLVEDVLKKMKISDGPVDVYSIAKNFGIEIRKSPSKEFSGFLYRKGTNAFVVINENEAEVRQRFTIAHEIGHFLLHKDSKTFIEYRDNKKDKIREKKEIDANIFAAELLMPQKFILQDRKKFDTSQQSGEDIVHFLTNKYNVSEKAMMFRLANLHSVDVN